MKALLGFVAVAALAGCGGQTVSYSYYTVPVMIDQTTVNADILDRIAACGVTVETPQRTDSEDLHCTRHRVKYDLGKFEYVTSLTSGAMLFKVVMSDFNQVPLAAGELGPIGIAPGQTIETAALTVHALPGASPDAGASTD